MDRAAFRSAARLLSAGGSVTFHLYSAPTGGTQINPPGTMCSSRTCKSSITCYKVRGGRFRSEVEIIDQFSTLILDVRSRCGLCAPVDKNGEGVRDPVMHLMCYKVRPSCDSPFFLPLGTVFLNNQFRPDEFPLCRPT